MPPANINLKGKPFLIQIRSLVKGGGEQQISFIYSEKLGVPKFIPFLRFPSLEINKDLVHVTCHWAEDSWRGRVPLHPLKETMSVGRACPQPVIKILSPLPTRFSVFVD